MNGNEMNGKVERINLMREIVHVNGNDYANYFVIGKFTLRGKIIEKRIRMDVPRNDVGMYDVLDMVFEDRKQVELYKIARINRDMVTGKKTTTYRYEVVNEAGDLKAVVVPNGQSNTALLEKVFNDLKQEVITEDNEEDI